jgi:hypothetical protein
MNHLFALGTQPPATRVSLKVRNVTLGEDLVAEGPRAVHAAVQKDERESREARESAGGAPTAYTVSVTFEGGTGPFYFAGTRNCTTCCGSTYASGGPASKGVTDFDVSSSGANATLWTNGTNAVVSPTKTISFTVLSASSPMWVRYTANAIFPQCALYNQEGLPAMPFEMAVAP